MKIKKIMNNRNILERSEEVKNRREISEFRQKPEYFQL